MLLGKHVQLEPVATSRLNAVLVVSVIANSASFIIYYTCAKHTLYTILGH